MTVGFATLQVMGGEYEIPVCVSRRPRPFARPHLAIFFSGARTGTVQLGGEKIYRIGDIFLVLAEMKFKRIIIQLYRSAKVLKFKESNTYVSMCVCICMFIHVNMYLHLDLENQSH